MSELPRHSRSSACRCRLVGVVGDPETLVRIPVAQATVVALFATVGAPLRK
jgi:hypothetical protein